MRDYGLGDEQLGFEKDVDTYISHLVRDFGECKRVLKDDGSLWVNLGEGTFNGHYNAIPHRFVIEMLRQGWILNDEIVWVKNNPVFTQSKKTIRAHEFIFHFVKTDSFYYDYSWTKEVSDPENLISIGTSGKIANLMSTLDFRQNVVRTCCNYMVELRKQCKEHGIYLTHNAAFPITIPTIAILTSTRPGDTVLDMYSGTGTAGEAALGTKREYIGYEIKSEFIKVSELRLSEYLNADKEHLIENAA
jgi:site-specific DNA-methyltransferase (adenine-specific)